MGQRSINHMLPGGFFSAKKVNIIRNEKRNLYKKNNGQQLEVTKAVAVEAEIVTETKTKVI